jgi:phage tail-like protein
MPPEIKHDQSLMGSWFALEIEGVTIASFTGVSGLAATTQVVEKPVSMPNGKTRIEKRPGRTTYDDIVLKRGLSQDKVLTDWHKKVVDGTVERKNGSIVMYDSTSQEIGRWNFENGWPSKWSASDLDASNDEWVIEEMTISHEFLERAKS